MRLIDADATIKYLRELRCKDCDKRKGMKNGKIRFCYEIGDAPCRACDIGDTIDYFFDEDISPTIDAIPVVRCKDCKYATMTSDGQTCKYCEIDTDDDGYIREVYHNADWYCADGEKASEKE